MDEITNGLMTSSRSAVDLQSLGKRASNEYLCKGVTLTDAVVKLANANPLTVEQVKRVVEFANNCTFLEVFDKQAEDKIVSFDPADPREVLRQLDVAARSAPMTVSYDYADDPMKLGNKNADLEADLKLAEAFNVNVKPSSKVKVAEAMNLVKTGGAKSESVRRDLEDALSIESIKQATIDQGQYRKANPFGELYRMHQDFKKLAEDTNFAVGKNNELRKQATAELTHEIKQHLLSGGNIGEAAHAMNELHGYDWTKKAMQATLPRLESSVLNPVQVKVDSIFYEMDKEGSARPVNLNNPLLIAFNNFVVTHEGQRKLAAAQACTNKHLGELERMVGKAIRVENAAAL